MYYFFKTEPSVYSFSNLQDEKTTIWDGVTNPQAVKNLREMPKGSKVVIYHTGDEKRVVGTASVISVDASDPKVPIKVGSPVKRSLTLAEIKAKKEFSSSPLVKMGRLSVVPLTEAQYKLLSE
jgi:predicted RNA-binding protein with PUA-like domain